MSNWIQKCNRNIHKKLTYIQTPKTRDDYKGLGGVLCVVCHTSKVQL
jgi:hypothetical protein